MQNITGTTQFSGPLAFRFDGGPSYHRARYYDPGTGRFLSEDLARFRGSVDFYLYAIKSPVDYIDPLGFQQGKRWYGWKGRNWVPGVLLAKCSIWSHYCAKVTRERLKELDRNPNVYTNEELSNHRGDEGTRRIRACTLGDENCKNLEDQCGGLLLGLIYKTGAFPPQ